ncbi:hypothetical protein V1517DRAFT_322257 [Lipomyces orientalis]|uniref:Uncharacterized protein n=1 Tax=Lipomyces orientalis TaxID=1233043 RepID=A0ACC3TNX0_9ASCO
MVHRGLEWTYLSIVLVTLVAFRKEAYFPQAQSCPSNSMCNDRVSAKKRDYSGGQCMRVIPIMEYSYLTVRACQYGNAEEWTSANTCSIYIRTLSFLAARRWPSCSIDETEHALTVPSVISRISVCYQPGFGAPGDLDWNQIFDLRLNAPMTWVSQIRCGRQGFSPSSHQPNIEIPLSGVEQLSGTKTTISHVKQNATSRGQHMRLDGKFLCFV